MPIEKMTIVAGIVISEILGGSLLGVLYLGAFYWAKRFLARQRYWRIVEQIEFNGTLRKMGKKNRV